MFVWVDGQGHSQVLLPDHRQGGQDGLHRETKNGEVLFDGHFDGGCRYDRWIPD